jgi:hypothetical protein
MTATKNTILAIGLILPTLAAGTARAQAYGSGCANASCEATCQGCGEAGCGGNGCQGGCGSDVLGLRSLGLYSDITACTGGGAGYAEAASLCSEFGPEISDLCERCAGCTWRVDATAIYLHRAAPTPLPLLVDPTSGASLLEGGNFEFYPKAGPRIQFVVTDCEGLGLELNYFAVDGWSVARSFGNSQFPSGVANLTVDSIITEPLSDAQFDTTSVIHSSEINLRQRLVGNIDILTGFRWIDMNDRYLATGTSAVTGNQLLQSTIAWNHLFGWQTGLDGRLGPDDGRWSIGGWVKAGSALNNANTSTALSDPGNLGSLAVSANECHVAFFGEAGLTGTIQIDKHISATFGYQVMFINNLAQPLNQIEQTDLAAGTTLVNVGSGILYHGANLGLDVCW